MSQATVNGQPAELAQLYAKIARVTAAMKRVPKNGVNSFQHYKYATESDIVDTLRAAMAEERIAIIPSVDSTERIEHRNEKLGPITRLFMHFTVACGDTGASISLPWIGDGQDTADKGLYKAYTGAEKYFLMKLFMVATGDDPEQDSETERPVQQQRPQPAIRQNQDRQTRTAELSDLRKQLSAIGGQNLPLTFGQIREMPMEELISIIEQTHEALQNEQARLATEAQQQIEE